METYHVQIEHENGTFEDAVPANDAVEAAEWVFNHLNTEVGVEIRSDLRLQAPGEDEVQYFPV